MSPEEEKMAEKKVRKIFESQCERERQRFHALSDKAKEFAVKPIAHLNDEYEVEALDSFSCPKCHKVLGYRTSIDYGSYGGDPQFDSVARNVGLCPHGCGQKILF